MRTALRARNFGPKPAANGYAAAWFQNCAYCGKRIGGAKKRGVRHDYREHVRVRYAQAQIDVANEANP